MDAVNVVVERALPRLCLMLPRPGRRVGPLRADPSSWRSEFDAADLALSGGEAEALVGDVERPVGTDGHAGRELQARDNRLGGAVRLDAHDGSSAGYRAACGCARLQRVQLTAAEGKPEHLLDSCRANLERPVAGEPPHVFVTRLVAGFEQAQVRDV